MRPLSFRYGKAIQTKRLIDIQVFLWCIYLEIQLFIIALRFQFLYNKYDHSLKRLKGGSL